MIANHISGSRRVIFSALHERLSWKVAQAGSGSGESADFSSEFLSPHVALHQSLLDNPSFAALAPMLNACVTLGREDQFPFWVSTSGLVFVAPYILNDTDVLAFIVRWAIESYNVLYAGCAHRGSAARQLGPLFHFGRCLASHLPRTSSQMMRQCFPQHVRKDLLAHDRGAFAHESVEWFARRFAVADGYAAERSESQAPIHGELAAPIETILCSSGDGRLHVNRRTGLSRYGTTPRPRPEAIHFSSSTASSVSADGFLLADSLRRRSAALFRQSPSGVGCIHERLSEAVADELFELFGLSKADADIILAPSGTDIELVAVMLSLSQSPHVKLTNILLGLEESGTSIGIAAQGKYSNEFSDGPATKAQGTSAVPGREVAVVSIPLRSRGVPVSKKDLAASLGSWILHEVRAGRHILLHGMLSSKTGLSGPALESIPELLSLGAGEVDVVFDCCQLRIAFGLVGELACRGWMIQVTGSKFLTGPPFSGALIVPARFRKRYREFAQLLAQAPLLASHLALTGTIRKVAQPSLPSAQYRFGFLFRWIPAILEAHLFRSLPNSLCLTLLMRMRDAVSSRIRLSRHLQEFEHASPWEEKDSEGDTEIMAGSIVCFSVCVGAGEQMRNLDISECRLLFGLLNLDVSRLLPALGREERRIASQPAHIGQPVAIPGASPSGHGDLALLRLVVGARYFTFIGHSGLRLQEAALEAEISDALYALAKVELLARHWNVLLGKSKVLQGVKQWLA